MNDFTSYNPVKIKFGAGVIDELGDVIGNRRVIVVTTQGTERRGLMKRIRSGLGERLVGVYANTPSNPTFEIVEDAFRALNKINCEVVVGLGGGSPLDLAKVVAAMKTSNNNEWLKKHLLLGDTTFPTPFTPPAIVTIPTTAGSGSEVSKWASIWDMDEKMKYSISHPALYPEVALCDPELGLTLSKRATTFTGLDALSHAVESIWNKNRNPLSITLAVGAIRTISSNLPLAYFSGDNIAIRAKMLTASLMAGLAMSNTQTALAHCISYPLTAIYGLPHGMACSLPLPWLVSLNEGEAVETIELLADGLGCAADTASVEKAFFAIFEAVGVNPYLSAYGVDNAGIEDIVDRIFKSDRLGNNLTQVDQSLMRSLLKRML
tara:strand:- start:3524 stop:4657 length:1134 start_codon:yes stop_codon:yes gene_type:complete